VRESVTPEGVNVRYVDKAFSIMSDVPIPYEATEYYFEVELLEDSSIPW